MKLLFDGENVDSLELIGTSVEFEFCLLILLAKLNDNELWLKTSDYENKKGIPVVNN